MNQILLALCRIYVVNQEIPTGTRVFSVPRKSKITPLYFEKITTMYCIVLFFTIYLQHGSNKKRSTNAQRGFGALYFIHPLP